MLRIGKIVKDSVVDGPGLRTVIFLAGCSHDPHCDGCHNQWLWPKEAGAGYFLDVLMADLEKHGINYNALTISGGEPLDQYEDLLDALRELHARRLGKDIWLYTGYSWKEINERFPLILNYVDTIVEGRFKRGNRDFNPKHFRGSKNQEVWKKDGISWKKVL